MFVLSYLGCTFIVKKSVTCCKFRINEGNMKSTVVVTNLFGIVQLKKKKYVILLFPI